MSTTPIGIRNPFAPNPAARPAQASRLEVAQAPVDAYVPAGPPELMLTPHREGGTRKMLTRIALSLTLAASVAGVVTPLMQDYARDSRLQTSLDAMNSGSKAVEVRNDLAPTMLPTPDAVVRQGGAVLSPDGHRILVSADRSSRLYNVEEGRAVADLPAGALRYLADSHLLSVRDNRYLELRNGTDGSLQATVDGGAVSNLSTAPVGGRAAYISGGTLQVVDAHGTTLSTHAIALNDDALEIKGWSNDGHRLVAVHSDNDGARVVVVDAEKGTIALDRRVDRAVGEAALSSDGRLLAVGGGGRERWDNYASVIDVGSGQTLVQKRGFSSVRFSPNHDSVLMFYASDRTYLEMVDARTGRSQWSVQGPNSYQATVEVSADGSRVVLESPRQVTALDAGSGAFVWGQGNMSYAQASLSHDGKRIAVLGSAGEYNSGTPLTTVRDLQDGAIVAQMRGSSSDRAQFSADDSRLLFMSSAGYYDSRVGVVDLAHSPLDATAQRAQKVALIDGMLDGSMTDAQRTAVRQQLDGVPLPVLRMLAARHTQIAVIENGQTPDRFIPKYTLASRAAGAATLRTAADRAFADADRAFAADLAKARETLNQAVARSSRTSSPVARLLGSNPAILDDDVRRAADDVVRLESARSQRAWSSMWSQGVRDAVEPVSADGAGATTLDALAKAHGATTPAEIEQFSQLVQALNGPRLERAQASYLEDMRKAHPEVQLQSMPMGERPFATNADVVAPSWYFQGGTVRSDSNMDVLRSWNSDQGKSSGIITQGDDSPLVVISEGALKADGSALRQQIGMVFESALAQHDPQFYRSFQSRLQDARSYRDTVTPREQFGRAFAAALGGNGDRYDRMDSMVRDAFDAASRPPVAR